LSLSICIVEIRVWKLKNETQIYLMNPMLFSIQ
jgi:hypothetical protein